MTLPTLANYAQVISVVPLFCAAGLLYFHHRCHHCARWGRFKVGPHQVPTCGHHRSDRN